MGGPGTGNRWQIRQRAFCDELKRLDIRTLRKAEVLTPGRSGLWSWKRGGEPCGSIGYVAHDGALQLIYRARDTGEGGWQDIDEHIRLEATPQPFGGFRQWFRCPRCFRRCMVLYGGTRFRCRQCQRLKYRSQNEDVYDRALSQAFNIRARLGDTLCGIDDGLPPRPKGMHRATYERLAARYDALEATINYRLCTLLALID